MTLSKWWTYQRERFPVFAHGALILAFSFSAVSFSRLLRGDVTLPSWQVVVVAFATCFLFFLQLRIADEFKDFEEDSRCRPYRPVPRGLITLRELGVLWIFTGIIQMGLAFLITPSLIFWLLMVWTYLALMTREFFAAKWLKKKPLTYMFSHMLIMPLVDYYATACDWWTHQAEPPTGIYWFVIVSFFNGIVIEVGRKIRAPEDEEEGVDTYSAVWGRRRAAWFWLSFVALTAGSATIAAYCIDFLWPTIVLLTVLVLLAISIIFRFLNNPDQKSAKRIEIFSGLWTILMYVNLGVIPLFLRIQNLGWNQ